MKKSIIITLSAILFTIALTSCSSKSGQRQPETPQLKAKLQEAYFSRIDNKYLANPASTIVIKYVDNLTSVDDAITLNGTTYVVIDMDQPYIECPFEMLECPNVQAYIKSQKVGH